MFLQFTPAYGFAFLQSGILPRAVFHKPPGRKTRCGKRTQTAVFHTVFAPQARRGNCPPSGDDAEVTPSGANAPAPPRGRLMAMPETLPPPPKAVPLRDDFPRSGGRCRVATKGGVWLDAKRQDGRGYFRAAMTEGVPHKKCRAVRRPSGIAFFFTSYCGTPAVRSGNRGSGCRRPQWW